jgi:hypothetical protein
LESIKLFLTARYFSEYVSVSGSRGESPAENFAALHKIKKTVIFIVLGPSLEGIDAHNSIKSQIDLKIIYFFQLNIRKAFIGA